MITRNSEWTPILYEQPPMGALCRFRDELTGKQWTEPANKLHTYFNDGYLLWKLTGIAKESM